MSYKSGLMSATLECCRGCFYRIRGTGNVSLCDYAFQTGKLRNCPPEECTHYTRKGRKRNKEQIVLKG